jgi:hypothetical protein
MQWRKTTMAYTWGYIKENTLSKLNLDEEEANQQGFLSRFPYQANEAMTQACSIKPKSKNFKVEVFNRQDKWHDLLREFGLTHCTEPLDEDDSEYEKKQAFFKKWNSLYFVDEPIVIEDDEFISFSDDVAYYKPPAIIVAGQIVNTPCFEEASDDILQYSGYNEIVCKKVGTYIIPYNARWFFFTKDLQNNVVIPAPIDILDCLPSYMASQCLKIDDEQKSAIFRNEYEMFLARIDDTDFKSQKTFHIRGNW